MIKYIIFLIMIFSSKGFADPLALDTKALPFRASRFQDKISSYVISKENPHSSQIAGVSSKDSHSITETNNQLKRVSKFKATSCDKKAPTSTYPMFKKCSDILLKKLSPNEDQFNNLYKLNNSKVGANDVSIAADKMTVILLSLNGEKKQAYEISCGVRELSNIFWHILSEIGTIQDLYLYTSIVKQSILQELPIRTRKKVIDRLLRSPAPNMAQKWIENAPSTSMQIRSLQYNISNGNYDEITSKDSKSGYLLSMAHQNAGNIQDSFEWLNERGFAPEIRYSEKLLGNPQPDDPTAWGNLSRQLTLPPEASQMPQLKAARFLIAHSEETRNSLISLMNEANAPIHQEKLNFEFSD